MEMVFEPAEDIANYPALWKAVYERDQVEIRTLLEGGANTEVVGGYAVHKTTPLQQAVRMNQYMMVKLLLKHGANVHVRTHFGETVLHDAVMMLGGGDAYLMARILLENGAVIDSVNCMRWTALHLASRADTSCVIRLLLDKNADVTLKTIGQRTAFEIASTTQNKNMLKEAEVTAEEARAAVNDRCLAFAMGQHKRLGKETMVFNLHPELMNLVLK